MTAQNKPTAAYYLSLIGAIIGIILGLVGSMFSLEGGIWIFLVSVMIIFVASRLNSNSLGHKKYGVIIIILSIIGVGTIVAILGGLLALIYHPNVPTVPQFERPTPPPSAPAPAPIQREVIREEITKKEVIVKIRCKYCGAAFDETLDKCPNCGAAAR